MSITSKILNHLQTVGDISRMEATGLYKSRHLPGIINTLRARGHVIYSDHRIDECKQRYVRYWMERDTGIST